MNTDDLIAVLAADTLPQQTVGQRLWRALPVAIGVTVLAFVVFWGARADMMAALNSAAILKTIFPLVLALLAGALAFGLARPGLRADMRMAALGLFAAGLIAAFAMALARDGVSGLTGALATPSLVTCLLSVPTLALPLLGAVFWALSAGAALRPRLTGAVAGLLAGGLSAALYSLHCDQDAALFVLPAYSTAILPVALFGAAIGPRLLKW
ncbi:DUF1109 domain-containing protein [Roseinatronobacter alkalisoli]|uniref:DUF1109 domain-containing protein n=1 Tax=Roseinatronobacter alkalisoli TaxID=3028235 RepID=A0ABT5T4E5_9RHOB|nr:DUF1109 domain-containing protein [Roseinatronobacter sp. HJB301]MDD7969985.1 DUF1109 domain-containing protein [Roseinatronobacter sp. HJB301]